MSLTPLTTYAGTVGPTDPALAPSPVTESEPIPIVPAPILQPVKEALTMREMIMKYVLNRLREPSTWAGIIAMLAGSGVMLTPEKAQAIQAVALSVMGALFAFLPNVFGKGKE